MTLSAFYDILMVTPYSIIGYHLLAVVADTFPVSAFVVLVSPRTAAAALLIDGFACP